MDQGLELVHMQGACRLQQQAAGQPKAPPSPPCREKFGSNMINQRDVLSAAMYPKVGAKEQLGSSEGLRGMGQARDRSWVAPVLRMVGRGPRDTCRTRP